MKIFVNQIETVQSLFAKSGKKNKRRKITLFRVFLWLLHGPRRKKYIVLFLDINSGILSFLFSYWVSIGLFSANIEPSLSQIMLFLFLIFLISNLYFLRGYYPMDERRSETELEIVTKGVSLAFLLVLLTIFIVFKGPIFSRYMLIVWWLSAIFMIAFFRFILREIYKALWKRGYLKEKILLIGSGAEIERVLQHLSLQRHHRFEYISVASEHMMNFLSDNPKDFLQFDYCKKIDDIIESKQPGKAFVFLDNIPSEISREVVNICRQKRVAVNLISNALFGGNNFEITLDQFTGFLILQSKGSLWKSKWNQLIKRAMDIFGSLIGIIVFTFIYPFIGLLIKLFDKGPILYKRRVVGRGGKSFNALKFRTMRVDADDLLQKDENLKKEFSKNFKLHNDPRLIKPGRFLRKWSLDEVPQFLNVFKGQMSLVGPRMIIREELNKFGPFKDKLLTAKPGMTGFWQVSGRQNTDYNERVKMDMFYINHWSIWMDIIILIKTVWKVLKREGAV